MHGCKNLKERSEYLVPGALGPKKATLRVSTVGVMAEELPDADMGCGTELSDAHHIPKLQRYAYLAHRLRSMSRLVLLLHR